MRRIFSIFVISLLITSCKEHNVETKPTFSVEKSAIEATDIGGYFEVGYTIA